MTLLLYEKTKEISYRIGAIILVVIFLSIKIQAQEMAVPVNVQVPLFLKILAFDRNLDLTGGDDIVIGIVYQCLNNTSYNAQEKFMEFLIDAISTTPGFNHIRCVPVDLEGGIDLDKQLSANHIKILYITPLRSISLDDITSMSRKHHVITLTGVPEYVDSGCAVGIGVHDEEPQILINRMAATAEGSDFSSQLLKLAKIIE